jgi:hypothetical protein
VLIYYIYNIQRNNKYYSYEVVYIYIELTNRAIESGKPGGKRVELASHFQVMSSELGMYHLLIERVSTITDELVQCRARVRIELN